jgi:pyridoxamine 5'-phosphate oxidase
MTLLLDWFNEAQRQRLQPNPNAMTLATVDEQGLPDARIVLCKDIDAAAGCFTFYTNYQSRKARELHAHPVAALVMHWDHLQRQVRIAGPLTRTTTADSDQYFASRHWQSRIGAWASQQSEPIASRAALMSAYQATATRFGFDATGNSNAMPTAAPIPRPPHWGGFCLCATRIELWAAGDARLHDRAVWTRSVHITGAVFNTGMWTAMRLQP